MWRVTNDIELRTVGAEIIQRLVPGSSATVLALSGELGAGKTTFTQGIAVALGVGETVSSPTFVIEKVYALSNQRFDRLVHIDAYRLKGSHELDVLGWDNLIGDPSNLIVLEWPERVEDRMPKDAVRVRFDIDGDQRIISINGDQESSS